MAKYHQLDEGGRGHIGSVNQTGLSTKQTKEKEKQNKTAFIDGQGGAPNHQSIEDCLTGNLQHSNRTRLPGDPQTPECGFPGLQPWPWRIASRSFFSPNWPHGCWVCAEEQHEPTWMADPSILRTLLSALLSGPTRPVCSNNQLSH